MRRTVWVLLEPAPPRVICAYEGLCEMRRIESEGGFEAGQASLGHSGVKVDAAMRRAVLERAEALGITPHKGFNPPRLEPRLVPVSDDDEIVAVGVGHPAGPESSGHPQPPVSRPRSTRSFSLTM